MIDADRNENPLIGGLQLQMAINADQNNMLIDPVNHPEPDAEKDCKKRYLTASTS